MRILKYLLVIAGLAGAIVALLREVREYRPQPQQVTATNPPPHSTVNVIATVIPAPAPEAPPVIAPLPPTDVGFNGVFESNRGLRYLFDQTGPRVNLYLLNPDGRRRYVGTAYDEGEELRFESFYSPVYERWGNFPRMHRRGDMLVSKNEAGVEAVYFKRAG